VDSGADKALKQATKLVVMNSLWALLVEGENETESASNGDPLPCVSTMLQCPSNECGLFDCFGVLFYLVIFVAGLYMIFIYRGGEDYSGGSGNEPPAATGSQEWTRFPADNSRSSPNRSMSMGMGRDESLGSASRSVMEDTSFAGRHASPGPAGFNSDSRSMASPFAGAEGPGGGRLVPTQQRRFMGGDGPLTPNDGGMRHSPRMEPSPRRMVHSAERGGMGIPEATGTTGSLPPAYQWTPDGISRR